MAHSTNIPVSPGLRDLFTSGTSGCGSGSRFILVSIDNEQLVPAATQARQSTLDADLELLTPVLKDRGENPAFGLVHTGDAGGAVSTNGAWALLAYVPSTSRVQDRMLYGATRETLKRDLGSEHFAAEHFVDSFDEWSPAAFIEAVRGGSRATGADMGRESESLHVAATDAELEKARADKLEAEERSRAAGSQGVSTGTVPFTLTPGATDAVDKLRSSKSGAVHLFLDGTTEQIDLAASVAGATTDTLGSGISGPRPLFVLHYVGDHCALVYYCPEAAPVRERMMASTCKSALIKSLKADRGVEIARSFECQEGSEIEGAYLREEIARATEVVTAASVPQPTRVSRPTRPGKGGARLMKK